MTIATGPAPSVIPTDAPLPGADSYSSLTTYEACPRRYAYRYVLRLPGEVPPGRFAFGRAIHAAFEAFVRERIAARSEGRPEPGLDVLVRACDEVLAGSGLEPDELAAMRAAATPVLERFGERERTLPTVPVAVELGFGMDVELPDGVPARFIGYLDRVDIAADGSTVICDYKTGRPRSQESVDADRQLTAYAWAAERGALRDPATGATLAPASRLSIYCADDGSEAMTTRSGKDFAAFERDLATMVAATRRREFHPRPRAWTCGWCEYRNTCADAVPGT